MNKYITEHPDKDKKISNVEFTLKSIDNVMDEHTNINPIDHPDSSITTSKIADLNVTVAKLENTLDLQPKTVYVKTPVGTNVQNEYPDAGGELSNTYTRTVIDSKLATKSDTTHVHSYSEINNVPTSMKNPNPLVINGQEYDGSNRLSVEVLNLDSIIPYVESLGSQIETGYSTKANLNHTHNTDEIIDFPEVYTKNEVDILLSSKSDKEYVNSEIEELKNTITELTERLERIEEKLEEEIIEIEEEPEGDN